MYISASEETNDTGQVMSKDGSQKKSRRNKQLKQGGLKAIQCG